MKNDIIITMQDGGVIVAELYPANSCRRSLKNFLNIKAPRKIHSSLTISHGIHRCNRRMLQKRTGFCRKDPKNAEKSSKK